MESGMWVWLFRFPGKPLPLREEGITVGLINSNPATIATDPVTADYIYLGRLLRKVEDVLREHQESPNLPAIWCGIADNGWSGLPSTWRLNAENGHLGAVRLQNDRGWIRMPSSWPKTGKCSKTGRGTRARWRLPTSPIRFWKGRKPHRKSVSIGHSYSYTFRWHGWRLLHEKKKFLMKRSKEVWLLHSTLKCW